MGALFVVGAALGFAIFGGSTAGPRAGRVRGQLPGRVLPHAPSDPASPGAGGVAADDRGDPHPYRVPSVGRCPRPCSRSAGGARPRCSRRSRPHTANGSPPRTSPAPSRVLKDRLADPTADVTCETLLVAHELGGTDIDRRLAALVEDRVQDVQGRKDARAKQAGVRFARRFVLIVPLGMALAGMSMGNGRSAYATPFGQLAVGAGIGMVVICWMWAGAIMRLPEEERVFSR